MNKYNVVVNVKALSDTCMDSSFSKKRCLQDVNIEVGDRAEVFGSKEENVYFQEFKFENEDGVG